VTSLPRHGMTCDWSLRQRLASLATLYPVFEQEGFRFAEFASPLSAR
jgi:hypothetical protein